jgi:hypothetical protein
MEERKFLGMRVETGFVNPYFSSLLPFFRLG